MQNQKQQLAPVGQKKAGFLYTTVCVMPVMLTVILFFFLNAMGIKADADANWYRYVCFFLPQVGFALALLAVNLIYAKQPIKLRLSKASFQVKPRFWGIALLLSVGTLFGLSQINTWFTTALEKIGLKGGGVNVPTMYGWGEYLLSLLVIAVLPAIIEEAVFRGVILNGIKEAGTLRAVLLSGVLFSLFHQNPAQTPYQLICGCLFALLALRSGSIFVPVVMHFFNNAFILSATFFGMPALPLTVTLLVGLVALVGGLTWLIFSEKNQRKTAGLKTFYLAAALGVVYNVIMWIMAAV